MCIIIHKSENVPCPSKDIIETCFYNNPDGAGMAILRPKADKVEIHKGFMVLKDFLDFAACAAKKDDIVTYHFRITTSGGTIPGNCHPFPVSDNVKDLKALSIQSRFAFIHNGVIGAGSDSLSDTQLYVKNTLAKMSFDILTEKIINKISQDTRGSRTVTIDARRKKVAFTGEWIHDEKTGLSFSNASFKAPVWSFEDYSTPILSTCPNCKSSEAELISEAHGLYECPECNCLFDTDKTIWAEGFLFD